MMHNRIGIAIVGLLLQKNVINSVIEGMVMVDFGV
jgi:hypothetical protein